jgi:hypothetical protein
MVNIVSRPQNGSVHSHHIQAGSGVHKYAVHIVILGLNI